jgi:hypothetical protein
MRHFIEVLQEIAEIEHWTRIPASGASAHPPVITWRYKDPPLELAALIRRAISTFAGAIAWEFTATDRNWSLKPARISEYARERGSKGGLYAASELKTAEPEFGILANAELPLLAEHIQRIAVLRREGAPVHSEKG